MKEAIRCPPRPCTLNGRYRLTNCRSSLEKNSPKLGWGCGVKYPGKAWCKTLCKVIPPAFSIWTKQTKGCMDTKGVSAFQVNGDFWIRQAKDNNSSYNLNDWTGRELVGAIPNKKICWSDPSVRTNKLKMLSQDHPFCCVHGNPFGFPP